MATAAELESATAPVVLVLVTVVLVELLHLLLRTVATAGRVPARVAELRRDLPALRRTLQGVSAQVRARAGRPHHVVP